MGLTKYDNTLWERIPTSSGGRGTRIARIVITTIKHKNRFCVTQVDL
jgi:hypothetical protein